MIPAILKPGLALLMAVAFGNLTAIAASSEGGVVDVRIPGPQEGLPAGWLSLTENNSFKVLESEGIRLIRARRETPGSLAFGLKKPVTVTGLAAFEVKMKIRSNKKGGILLGFRPEADPSNQQAFSAAALVNSPGADWREITCRLRGTLSAGACFIFDVGGPVEMDIAALSIRQIPLADYIPETLKPAPREEHAQTAFQGWIKETLATSPMPPVLFLGDSITDAWNNEGEGIESWNEQIVPLGAANWGIGANRIEHVLWQVESSPLGQTYYPRVIVLLIGINNLFKINSTEDIADGMAHLLQVIRKRSPDSRILLLGIYPARERPDNPIRARIREVNARYKSLADGKSVVFLDIGDALLEPDGMITRTVTKDFLHPTLAGYRRLAPRLVPAIQEMLSQ